MRKSERFAVSFLSLILSLILATTASAADLRVMRDPAQIASVFAPKARVRVLNVWATWCIPCVAEMPDLRVIDQTFGPEVSIAGVSLDDMIPDAKKEMVGAFLDKQHITFPNVYYTGIPDALGDSLRFRGEIPITIIYDAAGKELWRHQGRISKEETIATIRKLLRRTS